MSRLSRRRPRAGWWPAASLAACVASPVPPGGRDAGPGDARGSDVGCLPGSACDAAVVPRPIARACVPNAIGCEGATGVVRCNAGGTAWETVERCGAGQVCHAGRCGPACVVAAETGSSAGCRFYAAHLDIHGRCRRPPDDPECLVEDWFAVAVGHASDTDAIDVWVERRAPGGAFVELARRRLAPGEGHVFRFDDAHRDGSGLWRTGAYRVSASGPVVAVQQAAVLGTQVAPSSLFGYSRDWALSASTLYPAATLGGCGLPVRYRAVSHAPAPGGDSMVSVVAAVDGTTVRVRPSAAVRAAGDGSVPAVAAGEVAEFALDEGDVLALASEEGDLTGTYVEADAAVAVFGHREATAPAGAHGCPERHCSFVTGGVQEQMVPVDLWGRTFVAAAQGPFDPAAPWSEERALWKVVVHESPDDADKVVTLRLDPPVPTVGGGSLDRLTLRDGEVAQWSTVPAMPYAPHRFLLRASDPAVLVQIVSPENGEPAMVTVPPVERWPEVGTLFSALDPGETWHVTLARPAGAPVEINGEPVGGAPVLGARWHPVGGEGVFDAVRLGEMDLLPLRARVNRLQAGCQAVEGACGVGVGWLRTTCSPFCTCAGAVMYGSTGGMRLSCGGPVIE